MGIERKKCAPLFVIAALVVAGRGGAADGSDFERTPTAALKNGAIQIAFSLTQATDYAVFVKDAQGRTVRHLAARAADGSAQRLIWDGCDDDGRPVPVAAYRIEVALGLTPQYERTFGNDPRGLGTVHGLAVGPKGNLYVMGGEGRVDRFERFAVFSPQGKYLRTILPRPGSLPLDRVIDLGEFVLSDNERFPLALLPQYGGPMNQTPVVAPNGDLIFANGSMMYHAERHRFRAVERMQPEWPRRLLRLASDGGAPEAGYLGPILGKGFEKRVLYLALGKDGETIYISGAQDAVFKVRWGEREKPGPFVGTPGTAGGGKNHLKDPCGIALDDAGNLYVADRGNHRIACFDKTGRSVGELPVEWPRQLAVHPRARTIYVIAGYGEQRLLKFADLAARKPAADLALASRWPVLALDSHGEKATLYVGNVSQRMPGGESNGPAVIRLSDAGDRFVEEQAVTRGPTAPLGPALMGVDRLRELVYGVSNKGYVRWDGRSDHVEPVTMRQHPKSSNASSMTCGPAGTLVFRVPREIGRFDHRSQPEPFAVSGSFIARVIQEDGILHGRGCCVAPDGTIYRIHERGGQKKPMRVSTVKRDGTVGRDSMIVLETRSAAGIRVDREGSVYVLDHLKPIGKPVPDDLRGKVEVERHHPFVYHYGSVLKFRRQGGIVRQLSGKAPVKRDLKPGQMQFTTAEGRGDFVSEGVEWAWYGASMIVAALDRCAYAPYNCLCKAPRFDIDDFARVYVPDQLRCRIVVLDTDGRLITSFGRYGNIDDRGPEVTFADPRTVMVSDEAAYVGDERNDRVVKVRLDYRERASCTLRLAEPSKPNVAAQRLLKAETAVRALRAEVRQLSPSVAKQLDWNAFVNRFHRRSETLTLDDARAEVAVIAPRDVTDLPEAEARALLGAYLKSDAERVRVAAVWGLSGGCLDKTGVAWLRGALKDPAESVRVAAAYALLDRNDPVGLAEIFRGALSENGDVYTLAETAFLRQLLVWDSSDPRAKALDNETSLVPVYEMDRDAVLALGDLLDETETWYLRRSAMFLLGYSGDSAAGPPLLRALRRPERDRNLNRCIGGLGLLRYRPAVPDLLKVLARGHGPKWGTPHYNGDQAHVCASIALVRMADPETVAPIIALLDSERPEVRDLARRALTDLFAKDVPQDRCLVPKDNAFKQVRVDELPPPDDLRARWTAFWKANRQHYTWPNAGPPLRPRGR